jgi:hypothetical protein
VLDELPRRSGREEWLLERDPRVPDRVTAGNGLAVAMLGLGKKSALTEISGAKLSRSEVAGSVERSARSRCHPRPLPLHRGDGCKSDGRRAYSPARLGAVDSRNDVVPGQRIPRLRRFLADPTARLLEANLFARPLMYPPPPWYSVVGTAAASARLAADDASSKTRAHDTAASWSRSAVSTGSRHMQWSGNALTASSPGPGMSPPENHEVHSACANR